MNKLKNALKVVQLILNTYHNKPEWTIYNTVQHKYLREA